MSNESPGIELAEAIGQLRTQLNKAIKEGKEEDLRFEVQDLELELQVVATKDAKIGGKVEAGVKFWLVGSGKASAEGGLSEGTSRLQKIKLKLKPTVPGPKKDGPRQSALLSGGADEPLLSTSGASDS